MIPYTASQEQIEYVGNSTFVRKQILSSLSIMVRGLSVYLLIALISSHDTQACYVESRDTSFVDPNSGRTVSARLYYESNLQLRLGGIVGPWMNQLTIITFGHEKGNSVNSYESLIYRSIERNNNSVFVCPIINYNQITDTKVLALDMLACIQMMKNQVARKESMWYSARPQKNILCGHGFGASIALIASSKAAEQHIMITAVVALAPDVTLKGTLEACSVNQSPSLIIAGQLDCQSPAATNAQLVYNAIRINCKAYLVLNDCGHQIFVDSLHYSNQSSLCENRESQYNAYNCVSYYLSKLLTPSYALSTQQGAGVFQTTVPKFDLSHVQCSRKKLCRGDTVTLRYNGPRTSILWLPDSVRTIEYCFRAKDSVNHVFLESELCESKEVLSIPIVTGVSETVRIDVQQAICPNRQTVLRAVPQRPEMEYEWSTGERSDTIVINSLGKYSVRAFDKASCSWSIDSVSINYSLAPRLKIRVDTFTNLCNGAGAIHARLVYDPTRYDSIVWMDGTRGPELIITEVGKYIISAVARSLFSSACDAVTDPITLYVHNYDTPEAYIWQKGTTMVASNGDYYTWYVNGVARSEYRQRVIPAVPHSQYSVYVEWSDSQRCGRMSNTLIADSPSPVQSLGDSIKIFYMDGLLRIEGAPLGSSLRIVNVVGELVFSTQMASNAMSHDCSGLDAGWYLAALDGNTSPVAFVTVR